MDPAIERINRQASKIKLFVDNTLSKKFHIPVLIDDTTARAIAVATLYKEGDITIWLNESQQKLSDLRLEVNLSSHPSHIKILSERQEMHDGD